MAKKMLMTLLAGMIVIAGLCHADTLLVPSQYPTIQAGINASNDGDTVLVSSGTYTENIDFRGKEIVVKSEQGADFTVIDGDQYGSVVTFESGETTNSVLDGFTVENGMGGGSYPNYRGGGINCTNSSSPTITNNIFTRNISPTAGGAIACLNYSDAIITNNIIYGNTASNGGGIYGKDCFMTIMNNTITGNSASSFGGGIYGYYAGAIVSNNVIEGNTASYKGGGMAILEATHTPYPIWEISNNIIANNWGRTAGGGISIQCSFPPPGHNIINNTITENSADQGGAVALFLSAYPVITNSILWDNSAPEIYESTGGGYATVNYSNVTGGWTGTGNIDDDPLFIYPDQSDYRLQWGSPCIDRGDPVSPLDPDGTICDMGYSFYDQSIPVRILMTPHDVPIKIPASGSSFNYTIWATNIDPVSQLVNLWCDATLPDGSIFGPVLGPVSITMDSALTISRERTQIVPAGAPMGNYTYNAYATVGADTSSDVFTFVKLGSVGLDGLAGWFNTGEEFGEVGGGSTPALQEDFALLGAFPNPFNPITVISYKLQDASLVKLSVYDISGRLVTKLANGWRDAGVHEVTFDASGLTSGIYIYRLKSGDHVASGKMVLMK
ncbi:hypothetical protein CEE37_10325 [candidate division LCP-89 bacterium B3_LCP]|uniref:Secretion system C-terminal sorting domain-containing protein n=1 Tax=candidate division LCP-89 bacterium B3_LCP TaxID=2012998 RepID=A0A532UYY5_UNCL8|nr:MAG: hypothetical protein CEE37_10325 [candidate division LCP-89 bacterium B3_LCP]